MKSTTLLSELAVRETNWWCSKAGQNAGVLICNMQQGDDRWYICVYVNIVRLKASIYFPFLFSFFCYVHVLWMYMFAHVCASMYMCARVFIHPKLTPGVFFHRFPLYVLVWGIQMNLELPSSYLSALLMEFLFLPQGCWDYNHHAYLAFMCILEPKLLSSCLHSKSFIKLSPHPSSCIF